MSTTNSGLFMITVITDENKNSMSESIILWQVTASVGICEFNYFRYVNFLCIWNVLSDDVTKNGNCSI